MFLSTGNDPYDTHRQGPSPLNRYKPLAPIPREMKCQTAHFAPVMREEPVNQGDKDDDSEDAGSQGKRKKRPGRQLQIWTGQEEEQEE